jgi:hypothetical protein
MKPASGTALTLAVARANVTRGNRPSPLIAPAPEIHARVHLSDALEFRKTAPLQSRSVWAASNGGWSSRSSCGWRSLAATSSRRGSGRNRMDAARLRRTGQRMRRLTRMRWFHRLEPVTGDATACRRAEPGLTGCRSAALEFALAGTPYGYLRICEVGSMRVEVWVSSPEPAVEVFTSAGTCQGRLRRHS